MSRIDRSGKININHTPWSDNINQNKKSTIFDSELWKECTIRSLESAPGFKTIEARGQFHDALSMHSLPEKAWRIL
jgi:hypothetical protein